MRALAGGLALVIALLTVSTQAIRAALANPVEALKYGYDVTAEIPSLFRDGELAV